MPEPLTCHLRFQSRETPVRRGEPVTVGLPWPKGAVTDDRHFQLLSPDGTPQVLQTKVLDRWADGSVRWCLFDFLATVDGKNDGYRIEISDKPRAELKKQRFSNPDAIIQIESEQMSLEYFLSSTPGENFEIRQTDQIFQRYICGLLLSGTIDAYASRVFRVRLTLTNPNQSEHPEGNWDLGNGGSITIKSCRIRFPSNGNTNVSLEANEKYRPIDFFTLSQRSSGGENWQSLNHQNREHEIDIPFNGYQVTAYKNPIQGLRAEPIVIRSDSYFDEDLEQTVENFNGIAVPHFWENFPKAIKVDPKDIILDLFPANIEIQGGEQKTQTFYVAHNRDKITDDPMVWCRSPLICHADPEWYAASGAIPYLTPKASDPNQAYLSLVDQAIEGPDTFIHKREKIDEYGWRHFGDIYGDHEAVKHTGPTPLISHYNNQYDCVQAFLVQFFRSGDRRWLDQGLQCADHTCDIDIYHTMQDKAAYNGGLFWHTYHYVDADTGTHRSYPKSLRKGPNVNQTERVDQLDKTAEKLQKAYAVGGGPSASHNYNMGLMTAYFMTGNPQYYESAVDLARFVIRMEDPKSTPFRFLSQEYTGLATDSGGGGYHGPGRASANSIIALVVGHRLTGEKEFLDKAEQLIRRVCHPKQNLDRLDLLNAELRWFYTMHLQALGIYLDHKIEFGQLDEMYAYARLTLLHYARWMAVNERPILDTPEKLQFPTETWCAQDMRKVEVFQFAAKHASGAEKEKFLERAEWFFRYVERTLPTFATKSLCRPVVLMMKYGWSHNWWMQNPQASAPEPKVKIAADQFGEWQMFVPQKAIAMKRAKRMVAGGGVVFILLLILAIVLLIKYFAAR